jgi:hypothetical protein
VTRVRNLVGRVPLLRRIPFFVLLVAAGLVVVGVAAVVVFAGDDKPAHYLSDPEPDNHGFHVAGIAERYAGPAPMTIKFAAEAFHPTGKVHWTWRFDDGAVSLDRTPTHTFKEPGYYQILVDGGDEGGGIARMNVFIGIWPRALWEKAQSGKPIDRVGIVAKQWARTAERKQRIVANCLKIPVCRKQELAERKAKHEKAVRGRAACRKDPKCVRDTRKALAQARAQRRAAKRAGIPDVSPFPK